MCVWCLWSSRRKIVTNDGFSNLHRGSATFSFIFKIKKPRKIQQKLRSRFLLRFHRVDALLLKINHFIRAVRMKKSRGLTTPWSCAVCSTTFEQFRAIPSERLKYCSFLTDRYNIWYFHVEIMASCWRYTSRAFTFWEGPKSVSCTV